MDVALLNIVLGLFILTPPPQLFKIQGALKLLFLSRDYTKLWSSF
jgi:hypothetical protein